MPRIVFTGAPSSGKTTVAQRISARYPAWKVHDEIAARLIQDGRRSISEADFTCEILKQMIECEAQCCQAPIEIYDRAIPDSLTYLTLTNTPSPFPEIPLKQRYDLVFFFEPLPFKRAKIHRDFDEQNAAWLAAALLETYKSLDYQIFLVPVLDRDARTELVIKEILNRFMRAELQND